MEDGMVLKVVGEAIHRLEYQRTTNGKIVVGRQSKRDYHGDVVRSWIW
jgi:hypothetical protein